MKIKQSVSVKFLLSFFSSINHMRNMNTYFIIRLKFRRDMQKKFKTPRHGQDTAESEFYNYPINSAVSRISKSYNLEINQQYVIVFIT